VGVGLYADPWIRTVGGAVDETAHRLEAVVGKSQHGPASP